MIRIRTATQDDHKSILAIAKESPYSRDFSSIMFSSEAAYKKGWIIVAECEENGIVGFVCVRHKVQKPETTLYFLHVSKQHRRKGIGRQLLRRVLHESPHRKIVIGVMKDNEEGVEFWSREGFRVVSEDRYNGAGYGMELTW